jgi:hypothetical protein
MINKSIVYQSINRLIRQVVRSPQSCTPSIVAQYKADAAKRIPGNMSVQDIKTILARLLSMPEFWHDSLHGYPATEDLQPDDIALFVEWSQAHPTQTSSFLLTEEIPDDSEVQQFMRPGQGSFSMLAFSLFLEKQGMNLDQGLDIIYCLRPQAPEP